MTPANRTVMQLTHLDVVAFICPSFVVPIETLLDASEALLLCIPFDIPHYVLEDPPQCRQIVSAQTREKRLSMALHEDLELLLLFPPLFREENPIRPFIAFVDLPLDQPALLEQVEYPRYIVPVLERFLPELALIHPFLIAQAREHAPL